MIKLTDDFAFSPIKHPQRNTPSFNLETPSYATELRMENNLMLKQYPRYMNSNEFCIINQSIETFGWFPFGNENFECPGLSDADKEYYLNFNMLPEPCNECYKALIFLEEKYNYQNISNLFYMLKSFEIYYRGKLNHGVVVFYFRDKMKMLEFLEYLRQKMIAFNVIGKIQWRRACKEYQDLNPKQWKNAKEFISADSHKCINDFQQTL